MISQDSGLGQGDNKTNGSYRIFKSLKYKGLFIRRVV